MVIDTGMMKYSWVCAAWIHVYFSFVIILLVPCALSSTSLEDFCRGQRKRREDVFWLEYGDYDSALIGVIEEQEKYSLESSLDPVCSVVSLISVYLTLILVLVRAYLLCFWFTISLHQFVSVSTDYIRHGTVSLDHGYLCRYNLR